MGLRDHFRPPLHPVHHWESFHSNWATRIADALNERWLPREYVAEEQTHAGTSLEIAIATFQRVQGDLHRLAPGDAAPSWQPGPPASTSALTVPDSFEVRVLSDVGGATLVGVIALVSPANKDRPDQRRAFATKCAGFLHQGVSVIVIDVVTTRQANLHNEIVDLLGAPSLCWSSLAGLYAVAYRPVVRADSTELDLWSATFALGDALPTLPLRLQGDLFVPVDFASTYEEACRKRRIPEA